MLSFPRIRVEEMTFKSMQSEDIESHSRAAIWHGFCDGSQGCAAKEYDVNAGPAGHDRWAMTHVTYSGHALAMLLIERIN